MMKVQGEIVLRGDKSLSHRAVIFSALAKGKSKIKNFLKAEDTLNTLRAMQKTGVTVIGDVYSDEFEIVSEGLHNFKSPDTVLDMGNSGTAARLLLGLFSGFENIEATIDGDESLRKRPMKRITNPLKNFGASFEPEDLLPIKVSGKKLRPVIYDETLGSAQVKSALLLAAISSGVEARIKENHPSRDHSEKMLRFAGANLKSIRQPTAENVIELKPPYNFNPAKYDIWGDISSAAFFVVLGLLAEEGELIIKNVLFNPFRDRYIDILIQMGAKIEKVVTGEKCGESGGDLIVKPSLLKGISIGKEEIPKIIDELPVLTIAGLFAEGRFEFRGAEELRVKESDRIKAMADNLRNLKVNVEEFSDGLSLEGSRGAILEGSIESFMDHRIIMSFAIAREKAWANAGYSKDKNELIEIKDLNWVKTSFPDFFELLDKVVFK
ncbi:MAG: 3-phosphoshikimate 1-carboxyvinyltransferase [Spirochaetia bacterium]|nr:3-phosphoshikimate 1-carboxyvinyltransferase [Spirochaetia bacterium]